MKLIADYRYFLDVRIGCCAIRDTTLPRDHTPCLSPNMSDIVLFWDGNWDEVSRCWYLPIQIEAKASKICSLMNEIDKFEKTLKEKQDK